MKTEDKLICIQCGKTFKSWERFEGLGGEIDSFEEYECCSVECYNEWRLDNREELCN